MNKKAIVGLTNKVSIVAIFFLLYWVFIFGVSTVFGLKVFKENLTESFLMAILGILSLLAGSVIVNIMLNMTIIAETIGKRDGGEKDGKGEKEKNARIHKLKPFFIGLFILSFPVIALFLYFGDRYTSGEKERELIKSARYLIEHNSEDLKALADYSFDSTYITSASQLLKVLSKQDESFPSMYVIIKEKVEGRDVFLWFGGWQGWSYNKTEGNYIYSCSSSERKYLEDAYRHEQGKPLFSAADGKYELYFPVKTDKGFIVLYFTDHERYGMRGS